MISLFKKNKSTVIFIFTSILSIESVGAVNHTQQVVAECASFATKISNSANLGSPVMRANILKQQNQKCEGTGDFDTAVASLFQQGGSYDESDRAAQAGLAWKNDSQPYLMGILALNQAGRGHSDDAYRMALEIIKKFPKFALTYSILAGIDSQLNRWDKAYENQEKWIELDPSALSYMAIATSLYQLKRYPEVLDAVNRALQLDPRRIGNAGGLTEGIYALILLNRRDEAANLMKKHMRANPSWAENRAMLSAAKELGIER